MDTVGPMRAPKMLMSNSILDGLLQKKLPTWHHKKVYFNKKKRRSKKEENKCGNNGFSFPLKHKLFSKGPNADT